MQQRMFVLVFLLFSLSSCSQGGGGGGAASQNPDWVRAQSMFGDIQIEPEAGRGKADKALDTWMSSCTNQNFKKMNVKVGTKITISESLKYRQVSGDWINFAWNSSYAIDKVDEYQLFITGNHVKDDRFAKLKYRIWSGQTWVERRPLELLESSDEAVAKHFTAEKPVRDCRAKFGKDTVSTYWATYTLQSGQVVRGIVRKESVPMENYRCSSVDSDGFPDSTIVIADKATEQLLTFYSKEVINPLAGFCVRTPTLLSNYSIISSKGEVVELRQNEVTSIY